MSGEFSFNDDVTVTSVVSTLQFGAIFVGETPSGSKVRVRYQGRQNLPVVGDTFTVKGQWSSYTDKFRRVHRQVETKVMNRRVVLGELLAPFLQRVPNIGQQRAQRLVQHYGHELIETLANPAHMAEVAGILEPGKPALAARITAQLFAAMAEKSATDQVKLAEANFLVMLEKAGLREPRLATKLWRYCAGVDAIERLQSNPYLAAHFTSWSVADRIGKLLLRKSDPVTDVNRHPAGSWVHWQASGANC